MFVVDRARTVAELKPDLARIAGLPARGVIVTATATSPGVGNGPGTVADSGVNAGARSDAGTGGEAGTDFVSRFFAPQSGIPEDPVTGSAHTTLTPFWAAELGRNRLTARQLSARGGTLICEVRGARVHIAGTAALYLRGEIAVPDGDVG
jgi:predicted PhzF superfamily epimerase YddE/YHI9